jgi:hypothetical protein
MLVTHIFQGIMYLKAQNPLHTINVSATTEYYLNGNQKTAARKPLQLAPASLSVETNTNRSYISLVATCPQITAAGVPQLTTHITSTVKHPNWTKVARRIAAGIRGQSFWLQIQRSRVSIPGPTGFSEKYEVWNAVHSAS